MSIEEEFYWDWLMPIQFSLAAILTLPWMFIYIKSYIKGDSNLKKPMFYVGIVLFVTTFSQFTAGAISSAHKCHDKGKFNIYGNIAAQLFTIQFFTVIGVFFYRLYYIFDGTSLALSKITLCLALLMYIISFIFAIFAGIMYSQYPDSIGLLAAAASLVLFMCMAIALVILFIHKLCAVYKSEKNGEELMRIMTKTSILNFISIFATFINFSTHIASSDITSLPWICFFNLFPIADLYTNFLCILFTFRCFNNYYIKACGPCDQQCDGLCQRYAVDTSLVMISKQKEAKQKETEAAKSEKTQKKTEVVTTK